MARTAAVVGGTAHIAGNRQAKKDAEAAAAQAPVPAPSPATPAAAAPAPAAAAQGGMTEDTIAQLEQLGKLKADGVLTEEEFSAAKAKLLS